MDYVLPILNILIDGGVFLCIAYIIGTVAKCYAIHKICSAEKLSDAKVKWICKMMFKNDKRTAFSRPKNTTTISSYLISPFNPRKESV